MTSFNATFRICLSHDVDRVHKTFQYVTHFLKALKHGDGKAAAIQIGSLLQKDHYWNFEKIMTIEKRFGLKSTFFFLNETYAFRPWKRSSWRFALGYYSLFNPRVMDIMRTLDSLGWEIGLHGSFRSFNNADLLKREKADIENILGHSVCGIRQHYLNLSEETWRLQSDAGFTYDSSFGFTKDIGFKDNRSQPFQPFPGRRFCEIPLAIMDSCLMRKSDPSSAALKMLDFAQKESACLVLNWHTREFNPLEFPGYAAMYEFLIEEGLKRKAQFIVLRDLARMFLQS